MFFKIEDIFESWKDGKKLGVVIFYEINYLDRCLLKYINMGVLCLYVNIFRFFYKFESCGVWRLCFIYRVFISIFYIMMYNYRGFLIRFDILFLINYYIYILMVN